MGRDRQTDISFTSAVRSLVKYRPASKRDPNACPSTIRRNGGIYYGWRREGHVEGRYPTDEAARWLE
jgi:hypothetical protein